MIEVFVAVLWVKSCSTAPDGFIKEAWERLREVQFGTFPDENQLFELANECDHITIEKWYEKLPFA